jgi:hypothetical protein
MNEHFFSGPEILSWLRLTTLYYLLLLCVLFFF